LANTQKELEQKIKELEAKDKELKAKNDELEEVKKKFKETKDKTPSPILTETPKPNYDRGYKFRSEDRFGAESISVYNSLKQEIKNISSQISTEAPSNWKLKKQISDKTNHDKLDVWFKKKYSIAENNNKEESEHKSCLNIKHQIGYKSVDRQSRKYQDSNIDKSAEFRTYSDKINWIKDDKENISENQNYFINASSDVLAEFKDDYTPGQFKSYKSKVSNISQNKAQGTSFRSRSNAYNDSARSSLNMYQRKRALDEETSSYFKNKERCRDHFISRREDSNN